MAYLPELTAQLFSIMLLNMPRGRLIGILFLVLSFVLAVLILTDSFPYLRGPAPETSEWYWPYLVRPVARWWPAILTGLGMAGVGWWWLGRKDNRATLPLALLILLNLGLQLGLLYADRPLVGAELVDRTLSKASNGYLATAGEIADLNAALRHFPELMSTFDNDHARTHPPGLIIAHWISDHALRLTPGLSQILARPATFWRCTDLWVLARPPATAASLLLWSWLPSLLAAVAVVPAFLLSRRWFAPLPARLATLLVATLPALVIFVPTPDQIFAFLSIGSLYLLVSGLREKRRIAVVVAGLTVSLMSFLSLGNVAWAALLGAYAFSWLLWPVHEQLPFPRRDRYRWGLLILFGASAMFFWLAYWIGWGIPPWQIARVGLDQHYEMVTSLRRYDWWLGFNAIDFLIFAGPPVVIGLIWRAAGVFRSREGCLAEDGRIGLLLFIMLMALNLAGSTRGEVGRLWLVFMPAAAVVAGGFFGRRWPDRLGLWLILVAQLIVMVSIGLGWRPFSAVILPVEKPRMTSTSPETSLAADFSTPDGRVLRLVGYDPPPSDANLDEPIRVSLYWQANGATLRPYTVFVQLLDSNGKIIAQQDRWPVDGQWPSTCWSPGTVVPDRYEIVLPAGAISGTYSLVAGLYDAATGERLWTTDNTDFVPLEYITLER